MILLRLGNTDMAVKADVNDGRADQLRYLLRVVPWDWDGHNLVQGGYKTLDSLI